MQKLCKKEWSHLWNLPPSAFADMYCMAGDIYLHCHVYTDENSFCIADCYVLNERKLFGCLTVLPWLMKYRLCGTTCVHAFSDFFIQYMTDRITEELDSYLHGVNGLGKNTEWHMQSLWLTEILTTTLAVAILHSSTVDRYKMHSPKRLQRWKNDVVWWYMNVTILYCSSRGSVSLSRISCLLCNLETIWDVMIKLHTLNQMSCTRTVTLAKCFWIISLS